MKNIILILLMSLIIPCALFAQDGDNEDNIRYETGTISSISQIEVSEEDRELGIVSAYEVEIYVNTGEFEGQIHKTEVQTEKLYNLVPREGKNYILHVEKTDDGKVEVQVLQRDRSFELKILVLLFIISVILIGGFKGFLALLSIGGIIVFIFFVFIPLIIQGYSPVLLTIIICIFSTLLTVLLTNGFSRKSYVSILGTTGGILISGFLAVVFGHSMELRGVMENESIMLFHALGDKADLQGLLFGGIIIGALGAVMDVAVSIASSLYEIKEENPQVGFKKLFMHGHAIGTDVISTMVNTLILAYLGSSLSLILMLKIQNVSPVKFMSFDLIASEITRAIAGSIGIVATIPLTAFLASYIYTGFKSDK